MDLKNLMSHCPDGVWMVSGEDTAVSGTPAASKRRGDGIDFDDLEEFDLMPWILAPKGPCFPLLDLPGEVRIVVYKHILCLEGPIHVHPSDRPQYFAKGCTVVGAELNILLASKFIYKEAFDVFITYNRFSANLFSAKEATLLDKPWLSRIRHLKIHMICGSTVVDIPGTEKIDPLLTRLVAACPVLKSLKLHVVDVSSALDTARATQSVSILSGLKVHNKVSVRTEWIGVLNADGLHEILELRTSIFEGLSVRPEDLEVVNEFPGSQNAERQHIIWYILTHLGM